MNSVWIFFKKPSYRRNEISLTNESKEVFQVEQPAVKSSQVFWLSRGAERLESDQVKQWVKKQRNEERRELGGEGWSRHTGVKVSFPPTAACGSPNSYWTSKTLDQRSQSEGKHMRNKVWGYFGLQRNISPWDWGEGSAIRSSPTPAKGRRERHPNSAKLGKVLWCWKVTHFLPSGGKYVTQVLSLKLTCYVIKQMGLGKKKKKKNSTWMTFVYFLTSETLLHVLEYLLSSFKEQFHQCFSIMYFLQEKKMLWASLRYLGAGAAHCWAHLYRWASSYTYLSEVLAGGVTARVFSLRESRSVSLTERSYKCSQKWQRAATALRGSVSATPETATREGSQPHHPQAQAPPYLTSPTSLSWLSEQCVGL